MHSYENAAAEGAIPGRSSRRIAPAILLLALMLGCAWLSASALGPTLKPAYPAGGEPNQGISALVPSIFANDPTPTQRPGSPNEAPGNPVVLLAPPSGPGLPPTHTAGEDPQATHETPVATPEAPTATPVTPTATPETPTTTPETPTATPETPTATPVTPTATPETPTATPETPTATPATPTATPETPTATPVTPTATPVTPTATPVTPTATPVTPTATPVTPTPTPVCNGNTPDVYEADNNATQAQVISTDGVPQCHVNTNPVSEEDWVKFNAVNGHDYVIGTRLLNDINQSDTAANDTLLYLYAADGVTQLAFNDDVGYTTWYQGDYYYRESRINWTAPSDSLYYVRELQWGPTAGYSIRDYHWYELWVLDLDAPAPAPAAEIPAAPEAYIAPPETPTEEPTVTPTEAPTGEPTEAPTATQEP